VHAQKAGAPLPFTAIELIFFSKIKLKQMASLSALFESLPNDALSVLLSRCFENNASCVLRLRTVNRFFRKHVACWVVRNTMKQSQRFHTLFARMYCNCLHQEVGVMQYDYLAFASYLESQHFLHVFKQRVDHNDDALSFVASLCLFVMNNVSKYYGSLRGNCGIKSDFEKVCVRRKRAKKIHLKTFYQRFEHYEDVCKWMDETWAVEVLSARKASVEKKERSLMEQLAIVQEKRRKMEAEQNSALCEVRDAEERITKRAKRYESVLRDAGKF
jgi:hypothetical protein